MKYALVLLPILAVAYYIDDITISNSLFLLYGTICVGMIGKILLEDVA